MAVFAPFSSVTLTTVLSANSVLNFVNFAQNTMFTIFGAKNAKISRLVHNLSAVCPCPESAGYLNVCNALTDIISTTKTKYTALKIVPHTVSIVKRRSPVYPAIQAITFNKVNAS